ncbi:TetR family transcriptional regulator [Novosphingobium sp. FSY-8]|uniref:TetR family transcriptional regulator n=1 Tax=Novosphingobium ovatum TaxID=1908523 RepID=A0ABW9XGU4_9SPHN|nr:TetR/AcrR family transcriptional regulator [Novosphingobium ovatum]NBC37792.1 TetR family transcriptional regulator [Novosphingobium ovatum]
MTEVPLMVGHADNGRALTPRQAERRQRIFASVRQLITAHGCDAVSMRAIAADSGVTEKTLFNIFGSKDRLLAAAAFERSASVFGQAEAMSPEPGWPRLIALCDSVASVTLEAPDTARALAVPVIDHLALTGLDRLYNRHVGDALRVMLAQGFLAGSAPVDLLAYLVQLGMVSGVGFWAKGDVQDAELADYLRMRLAETLMPHAKAGAPAVRNAITTAQRALAARFAPPG